MAGDEAVSVLRPSAAAALAAYREQVEAHGEQVARLIEQPQGGDAFWQARMRSFRPGARESEEGDILRALARPDETWLDIGAGAGRLAVLLSPHVRRVLAIEALETMQAALTEATARLANVEVLPMLWPPVDTNEPRGDVGLAANLLYDATELGPFIESMEAHAPTCVVVVSDQAPRTPDAELWEALFGEPHRPLPAFRELVAVLGALGRQFDVGTVPVAPSPPVPVDAAHLQLRWRFGLAEGSERDHRLRSLLTARSQRTEGLVALPQPRTFTAVVTWDGPR